MVTKVIRILDFAPKFDTHQDANIGGSAAATQGQDTRVNILGTLRASSDEGNHSDDESIIVNL